MKSGSILCGFSRRRVSSPAPAGAILIPSLLAFAALLVVLVAPCPAWAFCHPSTAADAEGAPPGTQCMPASSGIPGQARNEPIATFSIVGYDPRNGDLGVAVESKFFAVGSVVPWAKAGVGAIATQAFGNTTYGPRGLEMLAAGLSPGEVIDSLTSTDDAKERRQVGIVDAGGNAATRTGKECYVWAGGKTGAHYAAQGNILTGEQVVAAMCAAYENATGELADKLLAALEAGQAAGGDSRGQQSAALMVVRKEGGYGGFNDRYIDLRVDDHQEPIKELGRLLRIQHAISAMYEASAFYRDKKYEEAITAARKAVEYNPGYGDAHYDLACLLSLTGDVENAIKSLATALELNPNLRSLAQNDTDLDNIKFSPGFKKAIYSAGKSQQK